MYISREVSLRPRDLRLACCCRPRDLRLACCCRPRDLRLACCCCPFSDDVRACFRRDDILQLAFEILSALSYLHERHVVHRCLEPGCVLMTSQVCWRRAADCVYAVTCCHRLRACCDVLPQTAYMLGRVATDFVHAVTCCHRLRTCWDVLPQSACML